MDRCGSCEACGLNKELTVCASALSPISHALCKECLQNDIHPYKEIVIQTWAIDGLQNAHKWFKDVVTANLKFYKKTIDDLNNDIANIDGNHFYK